MAKIHGFVYLIIGIFVSLVSYFSKNEALKLFIYIGFLFGFIGIVKLFISSLSKKKEKPIKQHPKTFHKQPIPKQNSYTKYCPHCRNIIRVSDNFCSRCGQALRR